MVQKTKSPFILIEDFLAPEMCEEIVLSLKHTVPNRDAKNFPIKTLKFNALQELRIMSSIDDLLDEAEPYYGFETLNISQFAFEWYAEGCKALPPLSDNSIFLNGKWLKTKDIDFTIIIFLSSTNDSSIRDTVMESFGGKMEFINHDLTITPKVGTMIMFPANHYFLNTFTDVFLGNLNCVRVHVTSKVPYEYKPENFPGDRRSWF